MSAEALVNRWIRPEIRDIRAYHVADAAGLIKLDAMENPYGWPEAMQTAWAALLTQAQVNRYPDPQAQALQAALRQAMEIPSNMGLLLGNGSDEIIQMLMLALGQTEGGSARTVLSVEPSFVMYSMIARFCGLEYVGVSLKASDFSLDLPALLAAIEQHQPALIFLAWPNNPTGNLFAEQDILDIIKAAPGLVVIDEAYGPFTDRSFLEQSSRFENLLVMRTLSKMGLAGLRLGYLVGHQALITEIDKVRMPYNINVLSQLTARFALEHKAVFDDQASRIRSERQRLFEELGKIPDISAFASEANFILIRVPQGQAQPIFNSMKDQGVLIKSLHGGHPLLNDCLRLTIGTPEENHRCLAALRQSLIL